MAFGTGLLVYAAAADMAFMVGLAFAVARPIIRARQKRQAVVLLLLALLAAANLLFYLGATGLVKTGFARRNLRWPVPGSWHGVVHGSTCYPVFHREAV